MHTFPLAIMKMMQEARAKAKASAPEPAKPKVKLVRPVAPPAPAPPAAPPAKPRVKLVRPVAPPAPEPAAAPAPAKPRVKLVRPVAPPAPTPAPVLERLGTGRGPVKLLRPMDPRTILNSNVLAKSDIIHSTRDGLVDVNEAAREQRVQKQREDEERVRRQFEAELDTLVIRPTKRTVSRAPSPKPTRPSSPRPTANPSDIGPGGLSRKQYASVMRSFY